MKYLGINRCKDTYHQIGTYLSVCGEEKTNTDEINIKDLNKWKYILCSWIQRLYIVKMSIINLDLYSQCNSNKNSSIIFGRNQQIILKFI